MHNYSMAKDVDIGKAFQQISQSWKGRLSANLCPGMEIAESSLFRNASLLNGNDPVSRDTPRRQFSHFLQYDHRVHPSEAEGI